MSEITFKKFTRGGQITIHAWRMAFQAYRAVVHFTLIISAIAYVSFFFYLSDSYQRYLAKEFLIKFRAAGKDNTYLLSQ